MSNYVECPFCDEPDFDLAGLKHHLLAGHCDVFDEIDRLDRPIFISPSSQGKAADEVKP